MGFKHITKRFLNTASEDELRSAADEIRSVMDELEETDEGYESDEYSDLWEKNNELVNSIASRFPLNLPKREHGWYLPNDDEKD